MVMYVYIQDSRKFRYECFLIFVDFQKCVYYYSLRHVEVRSSNDTGPFGDVNNL